MADRVFSLPAFGVVGGLSVVGLDGGERVAAPRLVQLLEARGRDGRGGEVRGPARVVLAHFLYEERLARLPQFHVNVQRLAIQFQIHLNKHTSTCTLISISRSRELSTADTRHATDEVKRVEAIL